MSWRRKHKYVHNFIYSIISSSNFIINVVTTGVPETITANEKDKKKIRNVKKKEHFIVQLMHTNYKILRL